MNNINRFYNYIISWSVLVLFSIIISLFLFPKDNSDTQFYFWGLLFIISGIICTYFDLKSSSQLKEYVKKRNPGLYRKYY